MTGLPSDSSPTAPEHASDAGPTRVALLSLSRGAGGAWAVTLAGLALTFVTTLVLAHLLGAEGYGALAYTLAWAEVLGMIAPLGFDKLLIRELAVYRQGGQAGLTRGLLRTAARWTGLGVAGALALALGFGLVMRARLDPELVPVFWTVALLVPLRAWVNLRHGALLGLSRPVAGLMASSVTTWLVVLASLGLALLLAPELVTPRNAALATAAGWLVSLLVADVQTRGRLDLSALARSAPEFRAREWIRAALPMMLIVAMALLNLRADVILLGAMRGASEAGIYSMAASLAFLVRLGLVAVNPALAPLAANARGEGAERQLQSVARSASRLAFLPGLVCALGLLVFGRWTLGLFGPEFTAGYAALAILATGFLVVAAMGPVETILLMKNQQRLAALAAVGACGLNLLLNLLLIPSFGLEGAAFATALSMIAWALSMTIAVRRRLGLSMSILARARR